MPQPGEVNAGTGWSVGVVPLPKGANALYPSNVEGSPGAGVTAVITPTIATRRAYLTKAIITSAAPAAITSGLVTISDGTWTLNFEFVETVSAGGALVLPFGEQPLVATTPNTPITVTVPAIAGGATAAIAATGYEL